MSSSFSQILILGIGLAGSLFIIIAQNSTQIGITLGFLYIVSFVQILTYWPPTQAAIKLITGLVAVVLLIFSQRVGKKYEERVRFSPVWFRLSAGLIAWVLAFVLAPSFNEWLPLPPLFITFSFVLVIDGLFIISLSTQPVSQMIGLLLALCGFETIYAALESSALVTALLSMITLSLSMIGSFIQTRVPMEDL